MEGELQQRLGRRMREHRARIGCNQTDFATLLGVEDQAYVSSIECGYRNVTLRTLEAYAGRLGVDPLDLLAADQ